MVTESGEKISKGFFCSSMMLNCELMGKKKGLGSACNGEVKIFDNILTF